MPFHASNALLSKLPAKERCDSAELGQHLVDQHGSNCHLCEGPVQLNVDDLEADHHIPEAEDGPTTLRNLRLAHKECNRAKRNLSSDLIRPFLKFRRHIRELGGRAKYSSAIRHWPTELGLSEISINGQTLSYVFPDGSEGEVPIFEERCGKNANDKSFSFAYVQVPRSAIHNDDEVQPRFIRVNHVFAIYNDLRDNPLHEPPSCRLGELVGAAQPLLMFDGQHKTLAVWMSGREEIVVKLYLDMTAPDATHLVNSIQAKIKKLPLSAFEVAGKMADEWHHKFDNYEHQMQELGIPASEAGFLAWLPAGPERNGGKKAFKAALIQDVLERHDFNLSNFVTVRGVDEEGDLGLTENMVKTKVLDKLIDSTASDLSFDDSTEIRRQEHENICYLLDQLIAQLVSPNDPGAEMTEPQQEARRRLFKQGSLQYVSGLLRDLFTNVMGLGAAQRTLAGIPSADQKQRLVKGVEHLGEHKVWTAALDRDAQMRAVANMLSTNQNVDQAFQAVHLTLGYLLAGPNANDAYRAHWMDHTN